jgi:hypothetical protein
MQAMAKRNTTGQLAAGSRVRVKTGVTMPEFPDVICDGWTGTICEVTGKKADAKYVIEWDDSVVAAMPESYVRQCEEKQYFYRMACFGGDEIEAV